MKMSKLVGETLRQAPADAGRSGHALLLRAAYIRASGPGLFSYLPLGRRSIARIEAVCHEELEAIGAQEVALPFVQPVEWIDLGGRGLAVGDEQVRFSDRAGRRLVLGVSHEEIAAQLAHGELRSHRRLPALVYQIRPVFRDEPRTSGGLMRAREFDLLACYSFAADREGLDAGYRDTFTAFSQIFQRLGLPDVVAARTDTSDDEGEAHDLVYLTPKGDRAVASCEACGYRFDQQVAGFGRPDPPGEAALPLEPVATPGADTIAALAGQLGIPTERTAKVVFFSATYPPSPGATAAAKAAKAGSEALMMALVRGDMEVSEAKLRKATGALRLRAAEAAVIRALGASPGYASPVGLAAKRVTVVADPLVAATPNLVCGANRDGFHLRNVNYGRDYEADLVADIAAAGPGVPCPDCRSPLRLEPCVELASLHRFGPEFTAALGARYQDESGATRPIAMGSYGLGLGRTLACIAEAHHDERGLRLPVSVAPYQVSLVAVGGDDAVRTYADRLYERLGDAGLDVLYDDREVSAGIKFNDADLIGPPLRVTVGARSLAAGEVELKARAADEKRFVPDDGATEAVVRALAGLDQRARPARRKARP